jgi:hypothetical protein
MEFDVPEEKLPPRKQYIVPRTAKPLYDTITKRILKPGEVLPDSDDEKEEGWLRQKSRDLINDFTDVTFEEKDFINTYNPFIINEHLTSPRYLPEALIRFTESHKKWFIEKNSRKKEFIKLMEVFILRGVVEEKTLERCIDILRAAERANKGKDIDMNDAAPPKPRALMDCICGEHTQAPNRVICRGAVSFASTVVFLSLTFLALPWTLLPSQVRRRRVRTANKRDLEMQSLSFLSICCIIEPWSLAWSWWVWMFQLYSIILYYRKIHMGGRGEIREGLLQQSPACFAKGQIAAGDA